MRVAFPLAVKRTCLNPGTSPRAIGPKDDDDDKVPVSSVDDGPARTQWTKGVGWPVAVQETEAPVSLFNSNLLGGSIVNRGP